MGCEVLATTGLGGGEITLSEYGRGLGGGRRFLASFGFRPLLELGFSVDEEVRESSVPDLELLTYKSVRERERERGVCFQFSTCSSDYVQCTLMQQVHIHVY